MTTPQGSKTLEEAAEIFLRLRDDPQNPELRARKSEFLARGETEREAYQKVLKSWQVTGVKKPSNPLKGIAIAAVLLGSIYLTYDPLRIRLTADARTGSETGQTILASGDRVELDAGTALVDLTDGEGRGADILAGAAFFDVTPDEKPFVVTLGELEVRVLGTAFEVAELRDTTMVTVREGTVAVKQGGETWTLQAGDRLTWNAAKGGVLEQIAQADIAPWRQDRLSTNGMRFDEVVSIIDRRLPGRIVILDPDVADTRIVGTFDLTDPLAALRTLAAIRNVRVVAAPPMVTAITP